MRVTSATVPAVAGLNKSTIKAEFKPPGSDWPKVPLDEKLHLLENTGIIILRRNKETQSLRHTLGPGAKQMVVKYLAESKSDAFVSLN